MADDFVATVRGRGGCEPSRHRFPFRGYVSLIFRVNIDLLLTFLDQAGLESSFLICFLAGRFSLFALLRLGFETSACRGDFYIIALV